MLRDMWCAQGQAAEGQVARTLQKFTQKFNNALALASEKVRAMVWAHAYAWSTGWGLRPPQTPPPPTFHAHK